MVIKVLGGWFGRNPFSKGFLPKSILEICYLFYFILFYFILFIFYL